jgi:hypothetical protein
MVPVVKMTEKDMKKAKEVQIGSKEETATKNVHRFTFLYRYRTTVLYLYSGGKEKYLREGLCLASTSLNKHDITD